MASIVMLASGNGSNFEACAAERLPIDLVITNKPHAGVIDRAQKWLIPWSILQWNKKKFTREEYARELISHIGEPDLVVLAGWMLIMPACFCEHYQNRLINLHPSLLPAYKGSTNAIKEAYQNRDTKYGVTVHWATDDVDGGEIISQETIYIDPIVGLEEISKQVHELEHQMLPRVIKELLL